MPDTLEKLRDVIDSRRGKNPENSYVAGLFESGIRKIAEKTGEEAVETVIAAIAEDDERLISESADLLFHLNVLWAERGIRVSAVMNELERRMGISGIDEKAARKAREKTK